MKFLPIYFDKYQKSFTEKYVIKIIIKPGQSNLLYCDRNFNCFIRRDGQVEKLMPDDFKKELISNVIFKREILTNL
jgi:hypothetical protein